MPTSKLKTTSKMRKMTPNMDICNIVGGLYTTRKSCWWLHTLTVTSERNPHQKCYHLLNLMEKCMQHHTCWRVQKKKLFRQRQLNNSGLAWQTAFRRVYPAQRTTLIVLVFLLTLLILVKGPRPRKKFEKWHFFHLKKEATRDR